MFATNLQALEAAFALDARAQYQHRTPHESAAAMVLALECSAHRALTEMLGYENFAGPLPEGMALESRAIVCIPTLGRMLGWGAACREAVGAPCPDELRLQFAMALGRSMEVACALHDRGLLPAPELAAWAEALPAIQGEGPGLPYAWDYQAPHRDHAVVERLAARCRNAGHHVGLKQPERSERACAVAARHLHEIRSRFLRMKSEMVEAHAKLIGENGPISFDEETDTRMEILPGLWMRLGSGSGRFQAVAPAFTRMTVSEACASMGVSLDDATEPTPVDAAPVVVVEAQAVVVEPVAVVEPVVITPPAAPFVPAAQAAEKIQTKEAPKPLTARSSRRLVVLAASGKAAQLDEKELEAAMVAAKKGRIVVVGDTTAVKPKESASQRIALALPKAGRR